MATSATPTTRRKAAAKSDEAVSYDEFKDYEGRKYTGMKIGRSHKWYYDKGEWKEKKITPDLWQISYAVTKRRAGRAPEGSGVPVGTEYHWYILAHQNVRKLNANDYTTSMAGLKFKIAHRRADSEKWSATAGTQRKRMVKFLREVIEDLERPAPEDPAESAGTERTASRSNGAAKAVSRSRKANGRRSMPRSMMKRPRRRRAARA